MSEEIALLTAIRLHPDEDTPRLIFADWLEEHDQADRAAFIRLQCEVARMPPGKEANTKAKQAEKLLKANKIAWFGELPKKFNPCHIDRGFITSLGQIPKTFVKHADDIARFARCLRKLVVTHVEESLGELLSLPFVRSVAEFDLETLHSKSLEVLNEYPSWGEFDALRMNFELDDEEQTLEGLSAAPIVLAAKRLDVQYGYFLEADEDLDDCPAAQEPSLREMRRLKIPHLRGFGIHGLDADSAVEFTRWAGFKRLDCLDFGLCNIYDDAAVVMLTAPKLPKLTTLRLNENSVGTPTAKAIADCPQLAELKLLTLGWLSLRDADANRLAASKFLPTDLTIDISYNNLTERGLEKLRKRFGAGVKSEKQY